MSVAETVRPQRRAHTAFVLVKRLELAGIEECVNFDGPLWLVWEVHDEARTREPEVSSESAGSSYASRAPDESSRHRDSSLQRQTGTKVLWQVHIRVVCLVLLSCMRVGNSAGDMNRRA